MLLSYAPPVSSEGKNIYRKYLPVPRPDTDPNLEKGFIGFESQLEEWLNAKSLD